MHLNFCAEFQKRIHLVAVLNTSPSQKSLFCWRDKDNHNKNDVNDVNITVPISIYARVETVTVTRKPNKNTRRRECSPKLRFCRAAFQCLHSLSIPGCVRFNIERKKENVHRFGFSFAKEQSCGEEKSWFDFPHVLAIYHYRDRKTHYLEVALYSTSYCTNFDFLKFWQLSFFEFLNAPRDARQKPRFPDF